MFTNYKLACIAVHSSYFSNPFIQFSRVEFSLKLDQGKAISDRIGLRPSTPFRKPWLACGRGRQNS